MSLIVQKYGGSSMGSPERIHRVAQRICRARALGHQLVVVVSAMQGETDRLLKLAGAAAHQAHSLREVDQLLATGEQVSAALLALTLRAMDVPARSFTAGQMRLYTDGMFSRARLKRMDAQHIEASLQTGEVVVATGFQGIDAKGDLTTLGRGGSDTSAVALAAVLGADACEIYTDVEGVFTADPRICPDAQKLDTITFDEMLEMASLGSKVLQIRSVELAMNHRVPLRVRSTFSDDPGTEVGFGDSPIERINVVGISHSKNEAKVTLRGLDMVQGQVAQVFGHLARSGVNVDVIVQNPPEQGAVDISFTVGATDLPAARQALVKLQQSVPLAEEEVTEHLGKVSIVGVGMMSHPGVAARMFAILHEHHIPIELITTSEIKVTTVVAADHVDRAVVALHAGFDLGPVQAA
jgi:aspartate kinase